MKTRKRNSNVILETFESLETNYGTDARDEIFKALKNELRISPLWLIIRHGLTVRGLEFISLADFFEDTGNRREKWGQVYV